MFKHYFALIGCLILAIFPLHAAIPVNVTVKPLPKLTTIPDDFAGLSYEMSSVVGGKVFNTQNTALIHLFQTLGVHNLRVGGDTVDRANIPLPSHADIDSLFQFAQLAGIKVIYCVRLKDGKIEDAVDPATYIETHYSNQLDCLAIGNEPSMYFKNYPEYAASWSKFYKAISAADPQIRLSGPGDWRGGWATMFAKDPGYGTNVTLVTEHEYPFGVSTAVKDPANARMAMLKKGDYNRTYQELTPATQQRGLKFRLEEANSYARGGTDGASNAYAASLWSLDYLWWWAEHECSGVNFHTGSFNHGGKFGSFRYAAFADAPEGGYDAMPLAYGMLAFKLAATGDLLAIDRSDADQRLRCYATLAPDHSVYVTLINRTCDPVSNDFPVHLDVSSLGNFTSGKSISLIGQKGDVSIKTGITLGGASPQTNGEWNGTWATLPIGQGAVDITVPAASALIVKFER